MSSHSVLRRAGVVVLFVALSGLALVVQAQPPTKAKGYSEPEALIGPLPFLGVHGLAVTEDGRLLAGSVVGQSLSQVDKKSGAVSVLIGPPKGMADDIAVGPNGMLAWTSYLAGTVRARTQVGAIRTLASDLPGINSLAFSDDGRLYASQVFLGDALYEIDTSGKKPPRRIRADLGGLNGFEVAADGWIYGPLWFKGKIVRVNPDNGRMETVAEGLEIPAAVNFDSQGRLYAVDTALGQLLRIDPESGEKTLLAQLKPSLDNLAIGKDDTIYVSNMADDSVQAVDPASGRVDTLVQSPLAAPAGLALIGNTLYIADTFAFRTMDTTTGDVNDVKRMWASDIHYPNSAWANAQLVILSSWATGTVQILDRKNLRTRRILEGFKAPHDAVQLRDGSLLVAELGTGSLLRVSGDDYQQRQPVVRDLKGPAGLALSADKQTVYLTTVAGQVWAIDIGNWSKTSVTGKLEQPEGITLTPDGQLIVMEVGAGRIVRIDPQTGAKATVAQDIPMSLPSLPGLPPTGVFNDVAVSNSGDVYFTTERNAGLYRIKHQ